MWSEHKDASGRSYFYNSDTKDTTWVKPVLCGWQSAVDPSGKAYYWNAATSETSWTPPPDWQGAAGGGPAVQAGTNGIAEPVHHGTWMTDDTAEPSESKSRSWIEDVLQQSTSASASGWRADAEDAPPGTVEALFGEQAVAPAQGGTSSSSSPPPCTETDTAIQEVFEWLRVSDTPSVVRRVLGQGRHDVNHGLLGGKHKGRTALMEAAKLGRTQVRDSVSG
jgi:hypothetical protein